MIDSQQDERDKIIAPEILKNQFSTDEHLNLRLGIHDRYSVPHVNFPEWVLRRVLWERCERVLDVGTGSGKYYGAVKALAPNANYVALDAFEGMLARHPAQKHLVNGNVFALPFTNASFDLVMANHMLYLLSDIDAAIREIRRVLKPGGVLVTATNSNQTMPEFTALFRRAVMLLTTPGSPYTASPGSVPHAYSLENAPLILRRHFYAAVRHDLPQALVFDHAEPALAYLESLRSMREPLLPPDVRWEDVMLIMREQIDRVIGHFGELVVNKISGVVIASDSGGFIQGYVERKALKRKA
ncbi:MAG: type 11 methyltransferase [Chloroflexi bacterium OLB15]|nr:MAG: type 11 methyltransferase [Chloroflexi bacterium OLB15]